MRHRQLASRSALVAERFKDQYAVTTRCQLVAAGLDSGEVDVHIAGRRWRQLNESVVVLHNGPLTLDQAHAAAVLSVTGPVALAAETAVGRLGMTGCEPSPVHVLIRRGDRVLPVDGVRVKVHESRRFQASDVLTPVFPPVVSMERAVIDAAVWSGRPQQACRWVANAVQQRLTTADRLLAELELAGKVRHRRLLQQVLLDVGAGAQALSELAFVRFCRRHGLPSPQLQVRLDSAGKRRYLDAVLRGSGGRTVHVEIDGGVHLTLQARWRDTARDNDLLIDGVPVLRFPSAAIYSDDPVAVAQIRRALGLVSS